MTIFDSGYSTFTYHPVGPLARLWPLTRMEFLKIFKTKKSLLLFLASIVYVLVKAVWMWIVLGYESPELGQAAQMMSRRQQGWSPIHPRFYMNYSTDGGLLPFLLMTCLVSVRSVSGDRAVNALEILWTRSISPWGYFLGKWMGSFLLLAAVFLAGPLLLWLFGVLAAPDLTYLETSIEFMPRVLLALAMKCLVLSFLAVGFSVLSSSPNMATFLWLLVILGTRAIGEIMTQIARSSLRANPELVSDTPIWYRALCPWDAMKRIEEYTTGLARPSDYPVTIAWACLGVIGVLLLLRMRKHLRTVEAVA